MTDYLNPHRIYPDDISRRIDIPPGFDSVRTSTGFQRDGGDKTESRRMANQCICCGQEMPEGVPMMVICELAPEVTVKTGERVSEQQARDSKEVLGLAFANKESIDVVIGWLNMIKDNYERLADPEQKEGESE